MREVSPEVPVGDLISGWGLLRLPLAAVVARYGRRNLSSKSRQGEAAEGRQKRKHFVTNRDAMTEETQVKLDLLKERHGNFLIKLLVRAGRELEEKKRPATIEDRIKYIWDSE